MVKYNFEGLEDRDIFACYTLAGTADGKIDEVEFAKLLDQRRGQAREEMVQLSQDLEKLEISKGVSKQDFERMGRVYLTSMSENCTMKEAEEIITTLDLKRKAKPEGAYGEIIKALELPKYDSPKEKSKVEKLRDNPQSETIEWVKDSGDVKAAVANKEFTTDSYRVAYDSEGNLKTLKRKKWR